MIKVQRLILRELSVPALGRRDHFGSQRPRRKPVRTDSSGRAQGHKVFNYIGLFQDVTIKSIFNNKCHDLFCAETFSLHP